MLIGGCAASSKISKIFNSEADLRLMVMNDVSGMGKLNITFGDGNRFDLLWKWSAKGF
jgi:hypothetical protein